MALLAIVMVVAAGCGDDDDGGDDGPEATAAQSVQIVSPTNGTSIKGNVITLDLEAKGIRIVKADGDTSGDTGHFHVFIDKTPVAAGATIEKAAGIVHSTDDPLKITGLKTGKHTLTVVLGDGVHHRIGTAADEVEVTVEGPTVDATAAATATAGQQLSIEAVVEGVQLVKADGDTSGKTGHLHAFIDKEPVAGQPIPVGDPMIIHSATSPIPVPALTAGEHTIWVVVGNGNHVPFDPPVMDKLTVTVS
jgi:uncharacterized protein (DUF736 family)